MDLSQKEHATRISSLTLTDKIRWICKIIKLLGVIFSKFHIVFARADAHKQTRAHLLFLAKN